MGDFVTVDVQQGRLRGRKAVSKAGNSYYSFQGIPYAKPPVGPLRFEDPQPPEPWTGVRDAIKEGAICPQYAWLMKRFRGCEDCLFLNVFTSELPDGNTNPCKAVMVWIHGGGFATGSGNSDLYGPDHLVDAGVVLVTMNYRLGPLGFLSLEDPVLPGNAGLKDQTAAIRWVQQNIDKFGGNPNNVTLFGESAGGSSVQYHMISPMSKGLFHKAIAQSGSSLNPWAMTTSLRSRAFQLGEVLGCKTTNPNELINFLRNVTAKDLFDGAAKTVTEEERRRGKTLPFLPIPETWESGGKDVFLPGNPVDLLREGKFTNVPFITGTTSHEGILELEGILRNPSLLNEIDNDFERHVPEELNLTSEKEKELACKIKEFYLGDNSLTMENLDKYVHLHTDYVFAYGVNKGLKLHAKHSVCPIYNYQFSFDGQLGVFKKFINATFLSGACHIDDLGYLFRANMTDVSISPESPEMKTLRRMVKMWTNFAKTGNPTPELDSDITIKWPPYTLANPEYLEISRNLSTGIDLLKERMEFWKGVYSICQTSPKD
ncbi:esterase B1 isoform X2 [Anabrus simplex]